jgi:hypothetical protein
METQELRERVKRVNVASKEANNGLGPMSGARVTLIRIHLRLEGLL